jgi:hypothetical protein
VQEASRRSILSGLKQRILRSRKQRVIKANADQLLRRVIGEALYQEWLRHGSIRFPGSDGGLFEVNPKWSGMVYELDPKTQQAKRKLCVHPSSKFPVEDRVAALFLGLKHDERGIMAKANLNRFDTHEQEAVSKRRLGRNRLRQLMESV